MKSSYNNNISSIFGPSSSDVRSKSTTTSPSQTFSKNTLRHMSPRTSSTMLSERSLKKALVASNPSPTILMGIDPPLTDFLSASQLNSPPPGISPDISVAGLAPLSGAHQIAEPPRSDFPPILSLEQPVKPPHITTFAKWGTYKVPNRPSLGFSWRSCLTGITAALSLWFIPGALPVFSLLGLSKTVLDFGDCLARSNYGFDCFSLMKAHLIFAWSGFFGSSWVILTRVARGLGFMKADVYEAPELAGVTKCILHEEVAESHTFFDLGEYPYVEQGLVYPEVFEAIHTAHVGTSIDSCVVRKLNRLAVSYFNDGNHSDKLDHTILLNTVMYAISVIRVSNARLSLSLPDHSFGKVKVSWR